MKPMEEIIAILEERHPQLEWECERAWIWVTSDIGPAHRVRGCACAECQKRAAIRKALGKEGLGFRFAKSGHVCPSGAVAYWGHSCTHPVPFRRRRKGVTSSSREETINQSVPDSGVLSDEELLAVLG